MKPLNYLLIVLIVSLSLFSCENKQEEIGQTPSEIQKEALVTALNRHSDLSEFVSVLEEMDFANIQAEELTVFALKNSGMTKSTLKVSNNSMIMKRHIVKGKHAKSLLSNDQKLTALDGTILTVNVSMEGGRVVYVNGVELGEEITAGKSVAHIVEKAMPETMSDISVAGVTLNETAATLLPGETFNLIATVSPEIAVNKNVTWKSSDDAVATVNEAGVVSALAVGTTTITVETEDREKTASCVVTVIRQYQMTMTTTASTINLKIGGTGKMTIDWGDGIVETHMLMSDLSSNYSQSGWYTKPAYIHSYTGASPRTITITGENVADLSCGADPIGCVPYNNQITSVDASDNIALLYLDCAYNQITNLDVSNNNLLRGLFCFDNKIANLDISKNILLEEFQCSNNPIKNLDVSKHIALNLLECNGNQLTSLDVSENTKLTRLRCSFNQLSNLDVSKNIALKELECRENQIKNLDISKNTMLTFLWCANNQLTSLDVSKNTALTFLSCHTNRLTNLDVSKNTALTLFECNSNRLTSLDVSKNTVLDDLTCADNPLTKLDVSKNTMLTLLWCTNNQLTSLDVSKNTALRIFACSNNQLISLDISKNTALTQLSCSNNQLTSLDVSKNTALHLFECYYNQISSLDVSKNTALTNIQCNNNQLTADGLNDLFSTLHNNTIAGETKNIYIEGNTGVGACSRSIAIGKGWTVH